MQNSLDSNQASQDSGDRPYVDLKTTNEYVIREFSQNIDPIELMWHRDDEDRVIEVIEAGKGWKFQYDDDLPIELEPKDVICILRHQWHRVHKGENNLILKINKHV